MSKLVLEFKGEELMFLLLDPYCDKTKLELLNGIDVLSLLKFNLWMPVESTDSRWLYCPFWLLNGLYGLGIFWIEWEFVKEWIGIDIMGSPFWFDNEEEDVDEDVDEVSGLAIVTILLGWFREGDEIADWFWVVILGIWDRRFKIELLFTILLLLKLLVFDIEGFVLLKLDSFLWWKCVGDDEDIGDVICWDAMRLFELFSCCSLSLWLESLERALKVSKKIKILESFKI